MIEKQFIGRQYEVGLIRNALRSKRPELGIVYGRRRVGKSSLLKSVANETPTLYFEGLQKGSQKKQIEHFLKELSKQTNTPLVASVSWRAAFEALSVHLKKGRSWYVVFDEFQWMANGRTELVSLFKFFWDNVWKENSKLTMVLCGSVAHFMIQHVIHSQALHNRKTFEIHLDPLSSQEAAQFFKNTSEREILQYLFVFGGIPKYLEQIDTRFSFVQNLDKLCFQKSGFFVEEFSTLFKEQYKNIKTYTNIVRALAPGTCTRETLLKKLEMVSGGGLTGYLENLENAGFIKNFSAYSPRGWSAKTRKIHLWDEWLRFYFNFVFPHREVIAQNTGPGLFEHLSAKKFDVFCGGGLEKLCLKNLKGICENLGVAWTSVKNFGPFFKQPSRSKHESTQGLQIDILLERADDTLMLFECKYSRQPVGVSVISEVERKIRFLSAPRRMRIEKILIAPGGVSEDLTDQNYFNHILGSSALIQKSTV